MSVLIRNMEMPTDCRECPFNTYHSNCGETICWVNKESIASDYKPIHFDGRPKWCPLVELPEHHGDLIDRDALSLRGKLKSIEEGEIQIYGGASWRFAGKCIAAIEDAPTIIEAEGAEE